MVAPVSNRIHAVSPTSGGTLSLIIVHAPMSALFLQLLAHANALPCLHAMAVLRAYIASAFRVSTDLHAGTFVCVSAT